MPRIIEDDEEDSTPVVGGSEVEEWKALADGNNEPLVSDFAMNDPSFPANCVFKIGPKPFLPAMSKIQWFRLVRPNWRLVTEEVEVTPKYARFRTTLFDENGNIVSTATKSWSLSKSPFFLEAAETGSVARALELAGFSAERAMSGVKF